MHTTGTHLALRDYQESAVSRLREGFRAGLKRQLLCAPTGSGKTFIAAWMARAAADRGRRVVFVADRIALVSQTSRRFAEFGIDHGVLQGENSFNRTAPVMVCSAQTLEKRGFFPDLDLLVVDECHTRRKATTEFLLTRNIPSIGLTATPFTPGLGRIWQRCIQSETTDKLTKDGWLAPLRVYRCAEADMAGATLSAGEWTAKDVARRGRVIIGDIVATWLAKCAKEFGAPMKTLVFSATVDHGEEICEAFQEVGHDFRQISYRDANNERRARLIRMYEEGEIRGLVSCEALAKGFDVPDTRVLISARNYRSSLAAHIQQIGRVMRAAPDKDFGLLLDHSGNWMRFRDDTLTFFKHGMVRPLDKGDKKPQARKTTRERKDLVCDACGFVMSPGTRACPACGKERKRRETVVTMPAELTRDRGVNERPAYPPERADHIWRQACRIALERKGPGEEAERCARSYYKNLMGAWPRWGRHFDAADWVDHEAEDHLRRLWRRWRRSDQSKRRKQRRTA